MVYTANCIVIEVDDLLMVLARDADVKYAYLKYHFLFAYLFRGENILNIFLPTIVGWILLSQHMIYYWI